MFLGKIVGIVIGSILVVVAVIMVSVGIIKCTESNDQFKAHEAENINAYSRLAQAQIQAQRT